MKLQTILMTTVLCLSSLATFAGQNVTIRPGDNVYEVLQTVSEPDSLLTYLCLRLERRFGVPVLDSIRKKIQSSIVKASLGTDSILTVRPRE